MEIRNKRCTVKGEAIDPKNAPVGTPTQVTLPDGQKADHYVLCEEDRLKNRVRPLRFSYVHEKCGVRTTMPRACAETYAVQPSYYGSTFCAECGGYFPVGINGEFVWDEGGEKVGT